MRFIARKGSVGLTNGKRQLACVSKVFAVRICMTFTLTHGKVMLFQIFYHQDQRCQ